jgi:hypothetical protein
MTCDFCELDQATVAVDDDGLRCCAPCEADTA